MTVSKKATYCNKLFRAHSIAIEIQVPERCACNCKSYHLLGDHDNSLDRELATAHIKKVLEGRTEQVNAENIVETLLSKVEGIWNTGCSTSPQKKVHCKFS